MKSLVTFDVVIVGAGLVGLTLACLLAKQKLRVAVIDLGAIAAPTLDKNIQELRVSAINMSCKDMFADLNLWPAITAERRYAPYEKMFVWDSLGRGEIAFDCMRIAEPCLGYIIENAVLLQALVHELNKDDGVTFFPHRQPTAVTIDNKEIKLTTVSIKDHADQEVISAELLVGADGSSSWVRQYAKIDAYHWPYEHEALVATVATEHSHQKTAWQCFLASGPLALLPLYQEKICSIVWSAPPQEIKRLKDLDENSFNREITAAFEFKLGNITRISKYASFPLYMSHAKRYIADRVALVGDAAHTIHPLAGQGVNLGFADVNCLADCILAAKTKINDCGDYLFLRRYERERKSDNWVMVLGMEFFKRLFENQSLITMHMRTLGLGLVNKSNLIKNQFIYRAIGR